MFRGIGAYILPRFIVYCAIYFVLAYIFRHTLHLIPALILLNPNNHYNHGLSNTFDYNHYVYSDYLVCSVPAIAHIIRY